MAHSSGGGSHSGGCHSSHSHSSGSRSGRSYNHSHRYFPGSRHYMYYDKNGDRQDLYCNYDPTVKPSPFRYLIILFYIPFILAMFPMCKEIVFVPRKLDNPSCQVRIFDLSDVIRDESRLLEKMQHFYDETGVAPMILTTSNEDWRNHPSHSLEDYALDAYYRMAPNEMCWVIVYADDMNGDFHDWYFEGMIGDDTGRSISEDHCQFFTRTLYQNLNNMTRRDPGKAFGSTFDALLKERAAHRINVGAIGPAAFFVVFIFAHMALMLCGVTRKKYYANARPVNDTPLSQQIP